MSKIIDIVKFNDQHAYVLDEDYSLTYEKHGSLLIGSDETQTFFSVLYYSPCGGDPNFGGNYAFAGRKFDLPMKDGTVTHCYGQYWDGKYREAELILGIELANFTHGDVERLKKCYVFFGGLADRAKLQAKLDDFNAEYPDYVPWGYWDYEKHIKGATQ